MKYKSNKYELYALYMFSSEVVLILLSYCLLMLLGSVIGAIFLSMYILLRL